MDYEKKYKDALERARNIIFGEPNSATANIVCEEIFPELKVCEDERIRKAIYDCVNWFSFDRCFFKDVSQEECLAWLEKQAEPQPYKGNADTMRKNLIKAFKSVGSNHWGGFNVKDILYFLESKDAIELEKQDKSNPYSGVSFEYNGHTWGMCARDNGVDILLDKQIFKHLEKQGEQQKTKTDLIMWKPVSEYKGGRVLATNDVDILVGYINSDGDCESEDCEGTLLCEITGFVEIEDVLPPKQGENKPADMVEPKFKVENWITDGEYTWNVTNIKRLDYILQSQNGDIVDDTISYVDEQFHLWTIEDARDGDVLAFDNGHIILVKENYNSTWGRRLSCWCHLLDGKFKVVEYHTKTEGLHPATKEQCALLFSKMKESGYEWNADKKELKNVEQNSVWSEEDDAYIALISGILNYEHRHGQFTTNGIKFFNNNIIAVEQIQDWLESLKDKVQPKWKPTEEQMNAFYWMKQYPAGEFAKKDILNSLYNDLKKL